MPRPTQDTDQIKLISDTGLSPPMVLFPNSFSYKLFTLCLSYNPKVHALWFGPMRVRSPLLAQSRLISFPTGT